MPAHRSCPTSLLMLCLAGVPLLGCEAAPEEQLSSDDFAVEYHEYSLPRLAEHTLPAAEYSFERVDEHTCSLVCTYDAVYNSTRLAAAQHISATDERGISHARVKASTECVNLCAPGQNSYTAAGRRYTRTGCGTRFVGCSSTSTVQATALSPEGQPAAYASPLESWKHQWEDNCTPEKPLHYVDPRPNSVPEGDYGYETDLGNTCSVMCLFDAQANNYRKDPAVALEHEDSRGVVHAFAKVAADCINLCAPGENTFQAEGRTYTRVGCEIHDSGCTKSRSVTAKSLANEKAQPLSVLGEERDYSCTLADKPTRY